MHLAEVDLIYYENLQRKRNVVFFFINSPIASNDYSQQMHVHAQVNMKLDK